MEENHMGFEDRPSFGCHRALTVDELDMLSAI
jgi:hypothetical protein